MMPTVLPLFLLSLGAWIVVSRAPRRPPYHTVQFKSAVGLAAPLVRHLRYHARQLAPAESRAYANALAAGAPLEDAMAILARTAFLSRWWHVGPLSPAPQLRALPDDLQRHVLTALAQVPPARAG